MSAISLRGWATTLGRGVGLAVLGLVATMVVRAARHAAAAVPADDEQPANAAASYGDAVSKRLAARRDSIAHSLARLLRLKTISYDAVASAAPRSGCGSIAHDHGSAAPTATPGSRVEVAASHAAILEAHALLEEMYPRMHAALSHTVVNGLSLVYVWTGRDPTLQATALYAHLDVVPVPDADAWVSPPFAGAIVNGYIVGRGAIDDKQSVVGICEAIEALLEEGSFSPTRTLAVVFGHDEEIGGTEGAQPAYAHLAAHLREAGVPPDRMPIHLLLDEGLFVLQGAVPGVPSTTRTALICTEVSGAVPPPPIFTHITTILSLLVRTPTHLRRKKAM